MSDSIGFLMADVSRLMRRNFDARARSVGATRSQWRVLTSLLRNEGINQGNLAERLEVEPITLSRMVDRLQEAGLVERKADPGDRRAWRLFLTPAAAPLITDLKAIAAVVSDDALDGLSETERDMLGGLLERVRQNLSRKVVTDNVVTDNDDDEGARVCG